MTYLLRFLPHVAIAAALIGGYWWLQHGWCNALCKAERAAWAESTQRAASAYTDELERLQRLQDASAEALRVQQSKQRQTSAKVERIIKDDPVARSWHDTPLPDGVRELLAGDSPVSGNP